MLVYTVTTMFYYLQVPRLTLAHPSPLHSSAPLGRASPDSPSVRPPHFTSTPWESTASRFPPRDTATAVERYLLPRVPSEDQNGRSLLTVSLACQRSPSEEIETSIRSIGGCGIRLLKAATNVCTHASQQAAARHRTPPFSLVLSPCFTP